MTMIILLIISWIIWLGWLSFSFFVIIGFIGFLFYRTHEEEYPVQDLELVIISVASKSVKPSLIECVSHHRSTFFDYPLNVVIDQGAQLEKELKKVNYIKLTIVPKSFRPDLVGKGRAMQYFIQNHNTPTWFAFLDDDNLILDDSFLYEIPYYEKHGYSVANPTLTPRAGKSKITYTMDFIRLFDDKTIFRFFTGLLKRPLLGLHGELLIAQGTTLNSAGTYSKRSVTEDYLFSTKINKLKLKSWQSKTRVSIKSPNSIKDLMKQRKRWFTGLSSDLNQGSKLQKYLTLYRIVLWKTGILYCPFVMLFFIAFNIVPSVWLLGLLMISGLYYYVVYLIGTMKARKVLPLFIIPFYGIIEALSVMRAKNKADTFEVINKE